MEQLMKSTTKILVIMFMPVIALFAQTNSSLNAEQQQKVSSDQRIDMLFDQIMRTIPDKSNDQHDSVTQQARSDNRRSETPVSSEMVKERRTQMTNELPDDLRKQVERAIEDIDLKKIEHIPSFKENHQSNSPTK
jgi:hypothetical protein